jgi:hypothetical protein
MSQRAGEKPAGVRRRVGCDLLWRAGGKDPPTAVSTFRPQIN